MVLLVRPSEGPEGPSEVYCSCCHFIYSRSEIRSSGFAFRLHVGSVFGSSPVQRSRNYHCHSRAAPLFVKRGLKENSCMEFNKPVCEEVQREKHESPSELYLQLELEELCRNTAMCFSCSHAENTLTLLTSADKHLDLKMFISPHLRSHPCHGSILLTQGWGSR